MSRNNPESPEPQNNTNAAGKRPPRTGVINSLILIAVSAAVSVAVGVFTLVAQTHADQSSRLQQQAERDAATLATSVANRLQTRRESLRSIAAEPSLGAALAKGDMERIRRLESTYTAAFPGARALRIVRLGELEVRPEGDPPIGYALVELVEGFSGDVTMEVHRPGQQDARLNVVANVRHQDEIVGHLIALYPAATLTAELGLAHARGWRLVQVADGTNAVLARSGDSDAGKQPVTASVPDTPWRVEVIPDRSDGLMSGASATRTLVITLAVTFIVLLVAYLVGKRLRGALQHDGREFHRLVTDTANGRHQGDYAAASPELEPLLEDAVVQARELIHRAARASSKAAAGKTAEQDTAAPADEVAEAAPATTSPKADAANDVAPSAPTDDASAEPGAAETPRPEPDPEPEPATETHASGQDVSPLEFTIETPDGEENTLAAVDPSILRAYDIRGVVGDTLTPGVMRALGQALGSEAADRDQEAVVVGYDGRHSSPELADALIEGLMRAGRRVIDIGAVPTPVVYFATHYLDTQAGVVVTGSHNPPSYNGLKMIIGGETLSGDAIQALGGRLEAGNLVEGKGSREQQDISTVYRERITGDISLARRLRVVVDCGNGIAGNIAPGLLEELNCEILELYCDVDGDFPNHHPDPSVPANLEMLSTTVTKSGADLGIAFDGDADRLGMVDNTGKIIWADRQLMLFARDVLQQYPGSDIIFDVKCTNRLPELIMEHAGVPVMWKTGHSLIKAKLRETGSLMAGEMSGHFFFNDRWYGFDDGIYAAARLLEILAADPRTAGEVFAELPEGLTTPELRVDLTEGEPPEVVNKLVEQAEAMGATRVSTIDGLRVDFPDGWGLVRASNTQPCLVLRFEGDTETALERIQALFRERLSTLRPGIDLPF
jgi:phosphomannomutase/phosphoglucomutase